MSTTPPAVQRSWTAEDEGGSGKWLVVSVLLALLVIGIYFFVKSLSWGKHAKVFVATFAVEEYDTQLLPEPPFAIWDIDAALGRFEEQGLNPWNKLNRNAMTTEVEVRGKWAALQEELKNGGANKRDTLVVYIRGVALAIEGEVYLLGSDFSPSDLEQFVEAVSSAGGPQADETSSRTSSRRAESDLKNAASMTRVLTDLQALPVANVVVLADFCDLPSVPRLGVLANDVPGALSQNVEDLEGSTPLWVITSGGSFQPTHVSFKRKKTLLQEACEFACASSVAAKSQDFVSLANVYDTIVRFSSNATGVSQSPLLLRSGAGACLIDSAMNESVWTQAQQVSLGRVTTSPNSEEASGENEQVDETAGDLAAGASESSGVSDMELTPALKYWQLHDRLSQRTDILRGWSPVDFAVQRWRKRERDAALYDQQSRIGDVQGGEMQGLLDELQQLETLAKSRDLGRGGSGNRFDLAAGWSELSSSMAGNRAILAWEDPSIMEPTLQAQWLEVRDGYRVYMDTMGRLAGWLELALGEPQGRRSDLLDLVDRQVAVLAQLDRSLPQASSDSLLIYSLPKQQLASIEAIAGDMDSYVEQRCDQLVQAIAIAKLAEGEKISWTTELQIQQLLNSPNVGFAQRSKLTQAYDSLEDKHLLRPGGNFKDIDRQAKLETLLSNATRPSTVDFFRDWAGVLGRTLALADNRVVGLPGGDIASLNAWGIGVSKQMRASRDDAAGDTGKAIQTWKLDCLADLVGAESGRDRFNLGLVLAPSDDKGLHVSVADRLMLGSGTNELELSVAHRNGELVGRCWIQYEIHGAAGSTADSFPRLQVGLRGGTSGLAAGVPYEASLVDGRLMLDLRLDASSSGPSAKQSQSQTLKVMLVAEKGQPSVTKLIELVPPRPNLVGLVAKQIDVTGQTVATLASEPTNQGWSMRQLGVPAIGVGLAKARYELQLVNQSSENKIVRVRVFDVQSRDGAAGSGRVTDEAKLLTNSRLPQLTPVFVSASTMTLVASNPNTTNAAQGQRIELMPAASAGAAAPVAAGEFGLLCVIEEVRQVEDGIFAPTGTEWSHWIDCIPQNPADGLVAIRTQDVPGEFSFNITLDPHALSRLQVEEVQVEGFVTDGAGSRIGVSGSSSVLLTKDAPVQNLRLRPDRPASQFGTSATQDKLFAHISIGKFPRSQAYESRLRGPTPGSAGTSLAIQPFVWMDPGEMSLIFDDPTAQPSPLRIWPGRDARIVPCQKGSNESSVGEVAKYRALQVPARIDFPRGNNAEVVFSLDGTETSYSVDRKFRPAFEAVGGNLVFSASVADHVHQFSNINSLRGSKPLQIVLKSGFRDVGTSVDVVFDRVAPKVARIVADSKTMYLNESLTLSLESSTQNLDSDTPIDPERVYFAIDRPSGAAAKYDASDELLKLKVQAPSGMLTAVLMAAQLEGFPRGDYRIVARTIDLAGNVQDENYSTSFTWIPTERPAAEPKPEPAPKPLPPPVAKKHTLRVTVTLGGKPLTAAQYRNTEVGGISAPVKSYPQGIWVYTLVPEGGYQVKATLSDNGVKYEGKASITVSPTSSANVSIALKPAG